MRKILSLLIIMAIMLSSVVRADEGPVKKLWRGVGNVVTSPVEVPKQARAYWITGAQKTPHILVWIFSGTVWGVVQGIKRAGSGVWDIISFPIDKPEGYASLMQPACVFDQWPRNPKSGL